MPYSLEKVKGGWFVITTETGKRHSNKPFKTKKQATAQLRAIYANANPDIEGAGFISDVYQNIKGRFSGVRNDYAPKIRTLLKNIGNLEFSSIDIYRKPVEGILTSIINVLTLGKLQQTMNEKGFDNVFHLYMKVGYPNGKALIVEKNEVINISPWNDNMAKGATMINVPLQGRKFSLNELLMGGQKIQGDNWFKYSAFNNNCQIFIKNILEGAGLYTPEINSFVYQDLTTLHKEATIGSKVADFITTSASKLNTFLYGASLNDKLNLGI